jgi:hypothetical protein
MKVRKERQYVPLTRAQFRERFFARFYDPALIGYYEPYATSHDKLDASPDIFVALENAAKSLVRLVRDMRSGTYRAPDAGLRHPRQK